MQPIDILKSVVGQEMSQSPSALAVWLKAKLLAAEVGKVSMEFIVRPEMTNPMKVLHGGIMSAMIDETMGVTAYTLSAENFYASINLTVDFLSSVRSGEKVLVKAEVLRQGKNVANIQAIAFSEDGRLLAKASSNLISSYSR